MRRQPIASYETEKGAFAYARELAKVWPGVTFTVQSHPWDFTYTVVAHMPRNVPVTAYVLKRPRGGPTAQHALIPRD